MYQPYERNQVRREIPPSLCDDLIARYIETAYADDAQEQRQEQELAARLDQKRLALYNAGVLALTGREQQLLRDAQYRRL